MKKIFLLYPIVVLAALSVLCYTSCKKPIHSNAPTPNNVRLHSYTATTKVSLVAPLPFSDTVNDNYTFVYDASNRLSQISATTNDTSLSQHGKAALTILFNYVNTDTVVKTTMTVPLNTFYHATYETDTFVTNFQGLITTTYEPNHITNYEYYGQLVDRQSETYYHNAPIGTSSVTTTTTVSEQRTYNSDNGDFLNYSFDGVLTATFPNEMTVTPYAMRDYWAFTTQGSLYSVSAHPDLLQYYSVYTQHGGLTGYTDQLSGYSEFPITVFAVDTSNDTAYCNYPGNNIYGNQTYTFYTTMANRIGDYLQLNSFTKWGNNLYRNNHLVKSISNSGYTTTISYNIDAYSKITQITAKTVDSVANTWTTTYNLQYETF